MGIVGKGSIGWWMALVVASIAGGAEGAAQCSHTGAQDVPETRQAEGELSCAGGQIVVAGGVGYRTSTSRCPAAVIYMPPRATRTGKYCFDVQQVGRLKGVKTSYGCMGCGLLWLSRCCRVDAQVPIDAGPDLVETRCDPCDVEVTTEDGPEPAVVTGAGVVDIESAGGASASEAAGDDA
jgi:hypothetical protein